MPDGALVLLYSGWDSLWGDAARYLGTGGEKVTWTSTFTNMHFPGKADLHVLVYCLAEELRQGVLMICRRKE